MSSTSSISTTGVQSFQAPQLNFVPLSSAPNNLEESPEDGTSVVSSPEPTVSIAQLAAEPLLPDFSGIIVGDNNGIPKNLPSNQDTGSGVGEPLGNAGPGDGTELPDYWSLDFYDPYDGEYIEGLEEPDDVEDVEELEESEDVDDIEELEEPDGGDDVEELEEPDDDDDDIEELEEPDGGDDVGGSEENSPTQTCSRSTTTSTIYPSWYTPEAETQPERPSVTESTKTTETPNTGNRLWPCRLEATSLQCIQFFFVLYFLRW
jgi:hypothetical protein